LQENQLKGREFRQNQTPEFATCSLKNLQILDFSQSTKLSGNQSAWGSGHWRRDKGAGASPETLEFFFLLCVTAASTGGERAFGAASAHNKLPTRPSP
jgi:hypothetical protein